MRRTADALDAAAPDFVPVAKRHLVRPLILRGKEAVADFGLVGGLSFGPHALTVSAEGAVDFDPGLRDVHNLIVHGSGRLGAEYLLCADGITLNYDATIAPILARTAELEASGAAYSTGLLQHELTSASLTLDAPAVSKLIRIVKGWDDATSTFGATPPVLLNGQHRVLAERFAWYRRWSVGALPTVLLGLKPEDVLRALRERRRELRAAAVRVVCAPIRRLVGQVERLAHAIVPHAPPTGLLSQVRVPVEAVGVSQS